MGRIHFPNSSSPQDVLNIIDGDEDELARADIESFLQDPVKLTKARIPSSGVTGDKAWKLKITRLLSLTERQKNKICFCYRVAGWYEARFDQDNNFYLYADEESYPSSLLGERRGLNEFFTNINQPF